MNFTEDKGKVSWFWFFSVFGKAGYTNLWKLKQKNSLCWLLQQQYIYFHEVVKFILLSINQTYFNSLVICLLIHLNILAFELCICFNIVIFKISDAEQTKHILIF